MVAYPGLAAEIDVAMIDASLDESAALVEVFDYCGRGGDAPHPTQAMIIERFKDSLHAELMFHAQAFSLELGETEDQSRAFVRHAVTKLGIEKKYQEIETLRERLQRGELSKEEQVLHGKMISEVKLLERQLQADARGAPLK